MSLLSLHLTFLTTYVVASPPSDPPDRVSPPVISIMEDVRYPDTGAEFRCTDQEGHDFTYHIDGGSGADLFEIDELTGDVRPARGVELDYELGPRPLFLDIRVTDQGTPPASIVYHMPVDVIDGKHARDGRHVYCFSPLCLSSPHSPRPPRSSLLLSSPLSSSFSRLRLSFFFLCVSSFLLASVCSFMPP